MPILLCQHEGYSKKADLLFYLLKIDRFKGCQMIIKFIIQL